MDLSYKEGRNLKEAKTEDLSFRISPTMKRKIELHAEQNDISNSQVVRFCIRKTLEFNLKEVILDVKTLSKGGEPIKGLKSMVET